MSVPRVLHLTASPFYGGPERGIISTVVSVPNVEHHVATFAERGASQPFVNELVQRGIDVSVIEHEMPHLLAATRDLVRLMQRINVSLLLANGHKARFVGYLAAKWLRIPIVGVSRGWTWQDWRTSLYERFDQWMHRRMDAVVCVSHGQAEKVMRCGVRRDRVFVIQNTVDQRRFASPDPQARTRLASLFGDTAPSWIIGAAGRLSPEKGFDNLIEAVRLCRAGGENVAGGIDVGLVIFGDGFLRDTLSEQIRRHGLESRIVLAGFCDKLDSTLHAFDLFVQSSHTEGMPNVLLEAMSAGVPVVATNVGGTPEIVTDGETGRLVPPADIAALANAISTMLGDDAALRERIAHAAHHRIATDFTVEAMGRRYGELIERFVAP
ncbi:MAG: glycosyltransferase [Thermoguttaceae bacterium]